jgi:hypothetical protein
MLRLILIVALVLFLPACAWLNKIAPADFDETGQPIPGTHKLTPGSQNFVDLTGPYGQAGVAIPLLVWNFIEIFKRKRTEKGLVATITALKQAGDDPKTKEAFEQIKIYLKSAHEYTGVKTLINSLIAKAPTIK